MGGWVAFRPVRPVEDLAREYVELVCEAFPVSATYLGRHEHDHRLGEHHPDVFEYHAASVEALRGELYQYLDASMGGDLDPGHVLEARALDGVLATTLLELEQDQQWRRNPDRAIETVLGGCFALLLRDHAPLADRVAALHDRLEAVPEFLAGAARTWSDVPTLWADLAADSALFGAEFLRRDLDGALEGSTRRDEVMAAASRAADALEWTARRVRDLGVDAPWAVGEHAFAERLGVEHHLTDSPSEVARRGHGLVHDTLALLEDLDPAWRRRLERTKDRHPAADELLDVYRVETERARAHVVTSGLAPDSDALLDVRPTPRFWAHVMPYAAYDPPGYFEDDQRGIFWVTVPEGPDAAERLRGHSLPSIVLTAVHEAYPGHHLQLTRANRSAGLVRTLAGSALTIEGWAHYCEQLLAEDGYFGDDLDLRLYQLKDQLWRAARVVLDVGLHCGQMGFDDAVGYLVEVADLEPANARAEVRRYTSSPTYQICYAIGKDEILALREAWRVREGPDFDLGRFHTELLAYGSVPVPLVSAAMLGR